MSNLDSYRDNILSKIKMNDCLEDLIDYINRYDNTGSTYIRCDSFCVPKVYVNNLYLKNILKAIIKDNNEAIDRYIKMSYDDKYWEHRHAEIKEENNGTKSNI